MKRSLRIVPATQPDTKRIKQAVRLFRYDLAPRSVRRHNARQWLRSIALLGNRWKLAEAMKLERSA